MAVSIKRLLASFNNINLKPNVLHVIILNVIILSVVLLPIQTMFVGIESIDQGVTLSAFFHSLNICAVSLMICDKMLRSQTLKGIL
jgi:hypothetical protein